MADRTPRRLDDAIETLRACEPDLRERGVIGAGIFGSLARGTATAASDVDVLVRFRVPPRLLDLGAVHYILERAFGEPVDVIEPASLERLGGQKALSEVRYAFG